MHRFSLRVALFCLVGMVITAGVPQPSVSPLQQLFVMKEIRPDLERIGVIWNERDANGSTLLPQLQQASASTGVRVYLSYANELTDLAAAYRELTRNKNVQAIWVIDENDPVTTSRMGRDYLIKHSASQGLPLIAPAPAWVEEGAHIAFYREGENLRLKVNRRSADAANMIIPSQYLERTDFLAAN